MASSDNMMTMEQSWPFRPAFTDPWISDMYSRETETLTKALTKSLSPNDDVGFESLFAKPDFVAPVVHTPSVSGGSENEVGGATPKPRGRAAGPAPSGRVTKRKSRASKRATTTFITADPANFRQMVQQVTGVRFAAGGGDGFDSVRIPLVKPEPQRAFFGGGFPTTLDTSSFLLDAGIVQPSPSTAAADIGGSGVRGIGQFEPFNCSFPTLESWKV